MDREEAWRRLNTSNRRVRRECDRMTYEEAAEFAGQLLDDGYLCRVVRNPGWSKAHSGGWCVQVLPNTPFEGWLYVPYYGREWWYAFESSGRNAIRVGS
jgi:hypothetical protein